MLTVDDVRGDLVTVLPKFAWDLGYTMMRVVVEGFHLTGADIRVGGNVVLRTTAVNGCERVLRYGD